VYESASGTDNAAEAALVESMAEVLGGGRAALLTDVDGTISPHVARPEDARVLPEARAALAGLSQLLTLVAVVTGRSASDARAMVGLDGLLYVGNHGFEVLSASGLEVLPEAQPWVERIAAALEEVRRQVQQPGILFENKGATASVHYRLALDPDLAREQLIEILTRVADARGLRFESGRMVFNLLPPLAVSKGSAVRWLAREYRLDRLVFLGDDITDVHAFTALADLRKSGLARAISIGVVDAETPPSIREFADACVPSADAVADLLCGVLDRLRTSGTMDPRIPTVER
jgi:trehalose 6-phosphate phosphatase